MHNRSCSFLAVMGLIAWAALIIIIITLSIMTGAERSLIPLYIIASFDFWAEKIPDTDYLFGYYYFPISQVLFSPFAWAGLHVGGILWRLLAFGLLTFAVYLWGRILARTRAGAFGQRAVAGAWTSAFAFDAYCPLRAVSVCRPRVCLPTLCESPRESQRRNTRGRSQVQRSV